MKGIRGSACLPSFFSSVRLVEGLRLMDVVAIVALVAAFAVPIGIEAFERSRLEIGPSLWSSEGPVNWTFATVRVRNRPTWWGVKRLLTRQAAQACVVDLEYYRWGTDAGTRQSRIHAA
jgi:hypothetical protein